MAPRPLSDCFSVFDARMWNTRQAWSGISEDRKTVVITLWQDKIKILGDRLVFSTEVEGDLKVWKARLGHKWRMKHIRYALDKCGGRFRAILLFPEYKKGAKKTTKARYPQENIWWRITDFNDDTGEYTAEFVWR